MMIHHCHLQQHLYWVEADFASMDRQRYSASGWHDRTVGADSSWWVTDELSGSSRCYR